MNKERNITTKPIVFGLSTFPLISIISDLPTELVIIDRDGESEKEN